MLPARRKLLGHAIAAQRVAGRRIEAASTVFNSTPTRRFAVVKEGGTHKHRDQVCTVLLGHHVFGVLVLSTMLHCAVICCISRWRASCSECSL